jgi:hypothetical protein
MQSVDPRTSCRSPITDLARVLDENAIDELISYYGPLLSVIANRHWCNNLQSQFGVSDAIQNTASTFSATFQRHSGIKYENCRGNLPRKRGDSTKGWS